MKPLMNQFKKIQTFGCSLTTGDDVDDKSKIWPNLLSERLSCGLENYGYSNASNQSIADKVVSHCNPKNLVIVCWTSQFRHQIYEHSDKIDYNVLHTNMVISKNEKLCAMPNAMIKMTNLQKKYVNEEQYYKNFLQTVLWLQEYLKFKKVNFLFCYGNSMSISFNQRNWNTKPQIKTNFYDPKQLKKKFPFVKCIDKKRFLDFDKPYKSFWENCVKKNLPLGATRHPLEEGHLLWANNLYKNIAKTFFI
jgi:hypothetical protein